MAIERTIEIADKMVKMKASADTPRLYRHLFGCDLFQDMNRLNLNVKKGSLDTGNTEVLENIAYAMAKQAEPKLPPIDEWLDQFGMFDIFFASGDILNMWAANTKTASEAKKK